MRLKRLAPIAAVTLALACVSAQSQPAAPAVPAFDGARAFAHVEQLVAIGPRPAGSPGAAKAREYIRAQMSALGLEVREQAFTAETPAGPLQMVNLSAHLPAGTSGSAAGRLIFASHYDTKRFDDVPFVGANDGGSSTGFLIELARVLKERKNVLPIELLFIDGEEAIGEWETGNTYGSRHYVNEARRAGTLQQIKAMILVDMIGERDLVIKRESNSTPWLTDAIWSAARQLKRPEFVPESRPIEDDHVPFLAAGVAAVDVIDLDYVHWHQPGDTMDKLSPGSLQVVGDVLLAALPSIELRVR